MQNAFHHSRHIAVGFIFVLVLMAGLLVVVLNKMADMQLQLNTITHQHNEKTLYLSRLKEGIRKRQIGLRDLIVTQDPFEKDDIRLLSYSYALDGAEARERFSAMELSDKEKEILERINAAIRVAYPLQNALAEKALFENDINVLTEELKATFDVQAVLVGHLNEMVALLNNQTQDAINKARISYDNAIYAVAVLGTAALLFGLFIAGYVFRTSRLQENVVNEAMQQLSRSAELLEIRVKERTRELEDAKQVAEIANHEKSRFLARMSHELRTPLNAIIGFTQIIEEDLGADDRTSHHIESLQHVSGAGRHLLSLVNDLLDLAKIEDGKMEYQITDLDLSAELDETVKLILPMAQKHNINIVFDADEFKDVYVRADCRRLKQVLLNMFSNGIKYNNSGGQLTIQPGVGTNGKYRLNITDTGNGIEQKDLELIFKAFSRLYLDNSSKEGTGIGLTIARQIVEQMHGRIGVDSTPGTGSTFWIELERSSCNPCATAADSKAVSPASYGHARSSTILYIEDNPANIALVRKALAADPAINLLTAELPSIGLRLALEHRPDLILLDICLPEMDGYAVQARLLDHPATRDIPIVALSAGAMPDEIEKGLTAGFRDYLTKPVDILHLRKTVHRELSLTRPPKTVTR